ncbi:MAG: hypothetical protein AAF639_31140 [Chloroflexota bacterium]
MQTINKIVIPNQESIDMKKISQAQISLQDTVNGLDALQNRFSDNSEMQAELAILEKHKVRLQSALCLLSSITHDDVPSLPASEEQSM